MSSSLYQVQLNLHRDKYMPLNVRNRQSCWVVPNWCSIYTSLSESWSQNIMKATKMRLTTGSCPSHVPCFVALASAWCIFSQQKEKNTTINPFNHH
jgi:hypothetical protein